MVEEHEAVAAMVEARAMEKSVVAILVEVEQEAAAVEAAALEGEEWVVVAREVAVRALVVAAMVAAA